MRKCERPYVPYGAATVTMSLAECHGFDCAIGIYEAWGNEYEIEGVGRNVQHERGLLLLAARDLVEEIGDIAAGVYSLALNEYAVCC